MNETKPPLFWLVKTLRLLGMAGFVLTAVYPLALRCAGRLSRTASFKAAAAIPSALGASPLLQPEAESARTSAVRREHRGD